MARWRATTSQGTFKPFFCFSPPLDLDITKDDATPPGPSASNSFALTSGLISLMKPGWGKRG